MLKYYIKSWKKREQSLLADINSINPDVGNSVNESYEITLEAVLFWGLIKYTTQTDIVLPRGFDVKGEFTKGRRYIKSKKSKY